MSFTMRVPTAVPSLVQSSLPWMPSSARKYNPPFEREERCGVGTTDWISFTKTVPAAVPSLFHSPA